MKFWPILILIFIFSSCTNEVSVKISPENVSTVAPLDEAPKITLSQTEVTLQEDARPYSITLRLFDKNIGNPLSCKDVKISSLSFKNTLFKKTEIADITVKTKTPTLKSDTTTFEGESADCVVEISPLENRTGIEKIIFSINNGLPASETLTLTINEEDDPVKITLDKNLLTFTEDDTSSQDLVVSISDPDSEISCSLLKISDSTRFTINTPTEPGPIPNGTLECDVSFKVNPNKFGDEKLSVSYENSTTKEIKASTDLNLSIRPQLDPIAIFSLPDSFEIKEDEGPVLITVTLTDYDSSTPVPCSKLSITGHEAHFKTLSSQPLNPVSPCTLSFMPDTDKNGTGSIQLSVINVNDGMLSEKNITYKITSVDDPPVITITSPSLSFKKNGIEEKITLTLSDKDSPEINCGMLQAAALSTPPATDLVTVEVLQEEVVVNKVVNCKVAVTPKTDKIGSGKIELWVDNWIDTKKSLSFTISEDKAPTIEILTTSPLFKEDGPEVEVKVLVFDEDSRLSCSKDYLKINQNLKLTLNRVTGTVPNCSLWIQPEPDKDEEQELTFTVTTPILGTKVPTTRSAFSTLTVNIISEDDPPEIKGLPSELPSFEEEQTIRPIPFEVSDIDSFVSCENVSVSAESSSLVTTSITGEKTKNCQLILVPEVNAFGENQSIILIVNNGASSTKTLHFSLSNKMDPPVLTLMKTLLSFEEEGPTQDLVFTVVDVEKDVDCSKAAISSSSSTLIGLGKVIEDTKKSNHEKNCKISITPLQDQFGEGTLSLSYNQETEPSKVSFTIENRNDAPVIKSVSPQSININGTLEVTLDVSDVDDVSGTPSSLNCQDKLIVTSSKQELLPHSKITKSGNPSACVLTLTPEQNSVGDSEITVTISDGLLSNSTSFTFTVRPLPPTISLSPNEITGTVGTEFKITPLIKENGAKVTCSYTGLPDWPNLPDGVSLEGCVISGTPTTVQERQVYSITVKNQEGSQSAGVGIKINPGKPLLSYAKSQGLSGAVGFRMTIFPSDFSTRGAPLSDCSSIPALPKGLILNKATCMIDGYPEVFTETTLYKITATNAAGPTEATVLLTVGASAPLVSYDKSEGKSGFVGVRMDITPSTLLDRGSKITNCTISPPLPPELQIDPTNCAIRGTPTKTLSGTYYVNATNLMGDGQATLTLSVTPSAPILSYDVATETVGIFSSEMKVSPTLLNERGAPITQCSINPDLPKGLEINSQCEILGIPEVLSGPILYVVTAKNTAGPTTAEVRLSVVVGTPEISYANATGSGEIGKDMVVSPSKLKDRGAAITECWSEPSLPLGLSIGSSDCKIFGKPQVSITSTNFIIKAKNSAGIGESSVQLSISTSSPLISYSEAVNTTGVVGGPMEVKPTTLNNQGEVITSCESTPLLPKGLSVSAPSCVILGIPEVTVDNQKYSITAKNIKGPATADVYLTVRPGIPALSYLGSFNTTGFVGEFMSVVPRSLDTKGGELTNCSAPGLPPELTVDLKTCVISGTPSNILSPTSFYVTATNAAGPSTPAVVTLTIRASSPVISYSNSTGTEGVFGTFMSVSPSQRDERGSKIIACTTNPLLNPDSGLSINQENCTISGTPRLSFGPTTYEVTATNLAGPGIPALVTLTVRPIAPSISFSPTSVEGVVGKTLEISPNILSNGALHTCSTTTTGLPAGMRLEGCLITGTPTTVGSKDYTITASNSAGPKSATVRITITDTKPEAMNISPTIKEDTETVIRLSYSDPDGHIASSCKVTSPVNLTTGACSCRTVSATESLCEVSVKGSPLDYSGPASFSYTVTTESLESNVAIASVTITSDNDAPTITIDDKNLNPQTKENETRSVPFTISDVDSTLFCDSRSLTATFTNTNPSAISAHQFSLVSTTGISQVCQITFTPTTPIRANASTGVTIRVSDNNGTDSKSATATMNLTINDVNFPPIFGSFPGTVKTTFEKSISAPFEISDQDSDLNCTSSVTASSSNTSLISSSGIVLTNVRKNGSLVGCSIALTPQKNQVGQSTITLRLSDGVNPVVMTFNFVVDPVPPEISFNPISIRGFVGNFLFIVPIIPPNGATTTCTLSGTLPSGLNFDPTTCKITGTPTQTQVRTPYRMTASNTINSVVYSAFADFQIEVVNRIKITGGTNNQLVLFSGDDFYTHTISFYDEENPNSVPTCRIEYPEVDNGGGNDYYDDLSVESSLFIVYDQNCHCNLSSRTCTYRLKTTPENEWQVRVNGQVDGGYMKNRPKLDFPVAVSVILTSITGSTDSYQQPIWIYRRNFQPQYFNIMLEKNILLKNITVIGERVSKDDSSVQRIDIYNLSSSSGKCTPGNLSTNYFNGEIPYIHKDRDPHFFKEDLIPLEDLQSFTHMQLHLDYYVYTGQSGIMYGLNPNPTLFRACSTVVLIPK